MKQKFDVIVVGGGVGCLCAAILLGAAGLDVLLLEASGELGGKAGRIQVDGVWMDTGPSVLTLPGVFESAFDAVGMSFKEEISLHRAIPAFRYIFRDGPTLDVFHEQEATIAAVHTALGANAAQELTTYLAHAERIWQVAEAQFVRRAAPSLGTLLAGGWTAWRALGQIDPFSTMSQTIERKVSDPYLRCLLKRYATYNGSDVRRAPGTLGCIAHVELGLGGFGVQGGMYRLVEALARALERARVQIELNAPVTRIRTNDRTVQGVVLADGRLLYAPQVIFGGDSPQLEERLLDRPASNSKVRELSMSAHTALFKADDGLCPRAAHTVIFPADYEREFADIFDHERVPKDPTIYICDQSSCHLAQKWPRHSPLFVMVNAPALSDAYRGEMDDGLRAKVRSVLASHHLLTTDDRQLWWRTPSELSHRFPGSRGALYGAASNDKVAAFRRPANTTSFTGLYLASGSAHPGGGLPMVAQSGMLAARAALDDRGLRGRRRLA